MIKEIGSEFWIEKKEISDTNQDRALPPWLSKFGNVVLTSSGRGAISLILDKINPKIKKVLLPSYICESIIFPFEKAGYELIFYDVDKNFCPINIDEQMTEIGIFFHMGYFGFRTNEVLNDIISKLVAKSVVIIEDVTHTLFSIKEFPMSNDFIVGSIRKWFGLPSGGFIASREQIIPQLSDPPREFVNLRTICLQQKHEYMQTKNKVLKTSFLEGFSKAERFLDNDLNCYNIDSKSEKIIEDIDIEKLIETRRSNYAFLQKSLKSVKQVEIIFDHIGNNVTPLFFPIYVNGNRDELRVRLISEEIYCPIHWPIPVQLNGHISKKTRTIYDTILSIPCDQRYGINDIYRIITMIKGLSENE